MLHDIYGQGHTLIKMFPDRSTKKLPTLFLPRSMLNKQVPDRLQINIKLQGLKNKQRQNRIKILSSNKYASPKQSRKLLACVGLGTCLHGSTKVSHASHIYIIPLKACRSHMIVGSTQCDKADAYIVCIR